MRIKSLNKPSFRTYLYSLTDFASVTDKAYNLTADGESLRVGESLKETGLTLPENCNVRALYHSGDKWFLHDINGNFYVNLHGSWIFVEQIADVNTYVGEGMIDGKMRTIIGTENRDYYIGDDGYPVVIELPKGNACAFYSGMLFVADENTLKFSALLNAKEQNGFIQTEKTDGDIIALIPTKYSLVIFTERAIYELVPTGERSDYQLKKQTFSVKPEKGSVWLAGGKMIFISQGAICAYESGYVNPVTSNFIGKGYVYDGEGGTDGTRYFARVRNIFNGRKGLLVCHAVSLNQSVIDMENCHIATDLITDGNKVYQVVESVDQNAEVFWESEYIDFGVPCKKTLCYLGCYANCDLKVEITGDCMKKVLDLKKGYNERFLNIPSYAFKISVYGKGEKVGIKDFRLKYRIRGE